MVIDRDIKLKLNKMKKFVSGLLIFSMLAIASTKATSANIGWWLSKDMHPAVNVVATEVYAGMGAYAGIVYGADLGAKVGCIGGPAGAIIGGIVGGATGAL
jgi:hypothetical protein